MYVGGIACSFVLNGVSTHSLQPHAPIPNPASTHLRIPFEIPFDGNVEIELADIHGRSMSTLHSGVLCGGRHELAFETTAVARGAYQIGLRFGGDVRVERVVIVD